MNLRITRWSPAILLTLAGSAQSLAACPFDATLELSSLNGTNGFVINGIDLLDQSGFSVSAAGDFNGDGMDDLIIGARMASPNGVSYAGKTYVVYGGAGIGAAGTFDLASLNGANGFVINGIDVFDYSGRSVSCAGDVNGDGADDLIIGAPYAVHSYVVFGGAGAGGTLELASLNGANGFVITRVNPSEGIGWSVSSAGDVNGDGVDDLIIGAYPANPIGRPSAGKSYVVFGAVDIGASGTLELATLNGTNGFVCNGIDTDDNSGWSVSSAGDVNGDGVDDLIIGARRASPNGQHYAGESYVVFGSAAPFPAVLELSSLNGANGFVCNGIDSGDYTGVSVASAGDLNGDGVDDLIIGAFDASPNGVSNAGESYVIFGSAVVGAGGTLELSSLNGANGFVINGVNRFDRSGVSVSSAGDVNGDGVDDLIIGAFYASPNGLKSGKSFIVFGSGGIGAGGSFELSSLNGINGFVCNGVNPDSRSGKSVSSAGDINGDGIDDVIIGAAGSPYGAIYSAGDSYVIFGQRALLPADLNNDGVTDTADLGALLGAFGDPGPAGDLNGDGVVDTADLGILLGEFGTTCP